MRKVSQGLRGLYRADYVAGYDRLPANRMEALVRRCELRPGDEVADFGCGPGSLLHHIHQTIASYCGIDFSEEFIDAAKRKARESGIQNARFECADIVEFCHRNPARFDKAFMFDVSHLIADEQLHAIYSGIRGSLRPSAKFYLHTINGDYFLEKLKDRKWVHRSPHYVAVRTVEQNRDLLRRAGFDRIHVAGIAHYEAPLSYLHGLSSIPGMSRCMTARLFIEAS
jgi:cyclopropane fatty-acyl-phospholipid synthase-like methyltransferase